MKEMIEIINKSKCYSCGNCHVSCPKHCISMDEDDRGFLYPTVNKSLCIECGLCLKVCPANEAQSLKHPPQGNCYSLISRDIEIKRAASSGGAFVTLVKSFLFEHSGKVYGAVYTSENNVRHVCYEKLEDCFAFSKSKYVKSECSHLFPQICEELKNGDNVLFSGSPCQVAALQKYLGKEYDNLTTVDFVCGGVPLEHFFKSYLNDLGRPVSSVIFRADNDMNSRNIVVNFVDGKSFLFFLGKNSYLRAFSENLTQMESCFNCDFCSEARCADITLGDFWGLEKVEPNVNPDTGISLVITNTDKGKSLFSKITDAEIKEYPISVASSGNPRLHSNLKKNEKFDIFPKLVKKYGFEKAVIKTLGKPPAPSLLTKVKTKIRNIIKGV